MNKQELIAKISENCSIDREEVEKVLNSFTREIKNDLTEEGKISIDGLGTFVLSEK